MDSVPSLVGLILAQVSNNAPSGFLVFLWGVATLTVLIGGIWGIPALYALWHDRRTVTAAPPRVSRDMPPTVPPVSPVKGVTDMSDTRAILPLAHMDLARRKNTIVAGAPGDGKTQTSIALMVADIAAGAQVFWLNPHYALFHPEDQTTDLHPLANHFHHISDYHRITKALRWAKKQIDTRMPLYRAGKDVGHHIVLYIDEAPAINEVAGVGFVEPLRAILREGRKCRVWVVLASQDAQVETLGLKSGLRNNFHTRLVGNVEQATWQALIGTGVPRPTTPLQRGYWHAAGEFGSVTIHAQRPSRADILAVAGLPVGYRAPQEVSSVSEETPEADRLLEQALHAELVPAKAAEKPPETGSQNSSGTSSDPVLGDTIAQELLIRRMADLNHSRNQIAAVLGGRRADALDKIRAVLDKNE